jgi:hypothetical protein
MLLKFFINLTTASSLALASTSTVMFCPCQQDGKSAVDMFDCVKQKRPIHYPLFYRLLIYIEDTANCKLLLSITTRE